MDSLMRDDIPDIVSTVMQAIPSHSTNPSSVNPQSQASSSSDAASPPTQAITPEEERQHQELGELQLTT